ncbi:hypothetical protein [Thiothrix fructosivorans]|uniref:Uncharacterized protein n=1 Tax=Thiothrix fructosivorans TaxID=111770 RepID=A0A8B0SGK0_9GAMM|nr:hypothetical protein [Thiothrix fructosivorans]MBO0615391.1 hypothetical protein [Thiothrix fructosivorans]QTX10164.1 hypothetical protein J1836_016450 [Thiothrix fructosivorans]
MNRHDVPAAQIAPQDFLDRVDLVETEVQRRKTHTANPKPAAYVTSLWLRWIEKNAYSHTDRGAAV